MRWRSWRRLVFSLGLLMIGSQWVFVHWHYDEQWPDVPALMRQHVSADDVRRQIQAAIDADQPDQARMYLGLAQRFGYAIDAVRYERAISAQQAPLLVAWRNTRAFSMGYVSGKARSAAGLAGAMASDFTVVGDARDLWTQYQHYQAQEPVDELVVILAGVGVAVTAATVGSFGSAAPARAGISLLKLAERSRYLSTAFRADLLSRARKLFDVRGFFQRLKARPTAVIEEARASCRPTQAAQFAVLAGHVNTIRQDTSLATTLALLRYVDSPRDLLGIERLARRFGPQTRGIMRFLGKSAIRTTRVLHKSAEWLAAMISLLSAATAAVLSLLSLSWSLLKRSFSALSRSPRGDRSGLGRGRRGSRFRCRTGRIQR